MLQMQLASMNFFNSMWWLEDIIFDKSLSLLRDSFNRRIVAFFETSILKEVRWLRLHIAMDIAYEIYKSSTYMNIVY